jgi:nucleotidyltransferase/DNA polymerase involved in DNA repair
MEFSLFSPGSNDPICKLRSDRITIITNRLFSTHKSLDMLEPSSPVKDLPGIGDKHSVELMKHGVETIADLAKLGDRAIDLLRSRERMSARSESWADEESFNSAHSTTPISASRLRAISAPDYPAAIDQYDEDQHPLKRARTMSEHRILQCLEHAVSIVRNHRAKLAATPLSTTTANTEMNYEYSVDQVHPLFFDTTENSANSNSELVWDANAMNTQHIS